MLANFTLQDIISNIFALILFSLMYLTPGCLTGWAFNFFDFRQRSLTIRLIIGNLLSVAISPIIAFLVYYFTSTRATILLFLLIGAASMISIYRAPHPRSSKDSRETLIKALLIACGWVLFSILFMIDIQWGNRLYYNIISYDFTTRAAIVNAITRSGVPPINPSYYPGYPVKLTYLYYFWYIPCSLVAQIGAPFISGYNAMTASVIWCGLTLMSTIALYLRLRSKLVGAQIGKLAITGIGLLLISGLDFIPALAIIIRSRISTGSAFLDGDIEHWNEQITAWIGSVSWAPHHVGALVACLTAVMLIHSVRDQKASKQLAACAVAGIAFASAVGLSVYVTMVFVLFWGIWMIALFIQKERSLFIFMVLTGFIAFIASSPFLSGLMSGNLSGPGTGIPITLSVRPFTPVLLYFHNSPKLLLDVLFLVFLPINYFIELGFFFISGILWIYLSHKEPLSKNPFYLSEIILVAVVLFIGSFVQSTAIASNDLGWRAWLPGQFVLLIWGANILTGYGQKTSEVPRPESIRRISSLRILIILGLLTTITDIILLRTWPMLIDTGIAGFPNEISPDTQLGKRTFAARQAYDYINLSSPKNTLIQDNPFDILNRPIGLYADRPIVISGQTTYGVSMDAIKRLTVSVAPIFNSPKSLSWNDIDRICSDQNINIIVATDVDALWKYLPELEFQRRPLYQNSYYAVLGCGSKILQ